MHTPQGKGSVVCIVWDTEVLNTWSSFIPCSHFCLMDPAQYIVWCVLNPGLIEIFLCHQFFQSSVAMLSGSSDGIEY